METEIDRYKRLVKDKFNKLVSDRSIADFKLDFADDVDENGTLNITAHVKLIPLLTYTCFTIKKSDFPEISHEKFVNLCDEIKYEIKRGLAEEGD